jgi:hypothetical protein
MANLPEIMVTARMHNSMNKTADVFAGEMTERADGKIDFHDPADTLDSDCYKLMKGHKGLGARWLGCQCTLEPDPFILRIESSFEEFAAKALAAEQEKR